MGGVIGFDMTAVLMLAEELGFDGRFMALLMPACEAGLVKGFAKTGSDDDEDTTDTE